VRFNPLADVKTMSAGTGASAASLLPRAERHGVGGDVGTAAPGWSRRSYWHPDGTRGITTAKPAARSICHRKLAARSNSSNRHLPSRTSRLRCAWSWKGDLRYPGDGEWGKYEYASNTVNMIVQQGMD